MKIGLILATNTEEYLNFLVPRGIGALAAYLERELPYVEVYMKESLQDLIDLNLDLIGISSTTECYHIAIDMANKIKAHLDIPVVIGGPHTSLLPESLDHIFDLGVSGEGEITFAEVLQSIHSNGFINYDELHNIKGIHYHINGKIHRTEPRDPINNLDSLPFIRIDNLPYYRPGQRGLIFSARGCPYKCSFCASTQLFKKYRSNSPEYILHEIEDQIERLNVPSIMFFDDLLIAEKKRISSLYLALKERHLLNIPFYCQVRANLIDDYTCDLLCKMNFVEVSLGIESFCDKTLAYYNKAGITGEINQKAIDCLHKHGIRVNGSYIFGAPNETKEDMQVTFRSLYNNFKQNKINNPSWGILRPMPGTKVWDDASEMGLVHENMCWEKLGNWSNFETYMNTQMPISDFLLLLNEWTTKYTLLKLRNSSIEELKGQMFCISDPAELSRSIQLNANIIRQRHFNTNIVEPGDDLILNHNIITLSDNLNTCTLNFQHWFSATVVHVNSLNYSTAPKFKYTLLERAPFSVNYHDEVSSLLCELKNLDLETPIPTKQNFELTRRAANDLLNPANSESHFSILAQACNALYRVYGPTPKQFKIFEFAPRNNSLSEYFSKIFDISTTQIDKIDTKHSHLHDSLENPKPTEPILSTIAQYISDHEFYHDAIIFNSCFHHNLDFNLILELLNLKLSDMPTPILFLQERIFDDFEYPWGLSTNTEDVLSMIFTHQPELTFRTDFFMSLLMRHGFLPSFIPPLGNVLSGLIGYHKTISMDKWYLPFEISNSWHPASSNEHYRFSKGTSYLPGLKNCYFNKYEITLHNFSKEVMNINICAGNNFITIPLPPASPSNIIIDADSDEKIAMIGPLYIPDRVYKNGDNRELSYAVSSVCLL